MGGFTLGNLNPPKSRVVQPNPPMGWVGFGLPRLLEHPQNRFMAFRRTDGEIKPLTLVVQGILCATLYGGEIQSEKEAHTLLSITPDNRLEVMSGFSPVSLTWCR